MEKQILDIIFSRRSVRQYTDEPVSKEIMIDLLKAAMAAPSACNNKPWEYIAITNSAMMDDLRSVMAYGKYNAPAAFVVLYNDALGSSPACSPFWQQDLSASVENILIAAAGMNLGTVWLGAHPKEDVVTTLQTLFHIPKSVIPLAVLYVGHPAESVKARTQFEENRVHWNQY
ncbi:MAG: nitroreductase family protein [Anaerolineaceae bacterium]|nr:nitroreductase family protein [Anaerolineaceae bacterium]